MTFRYWRAAHEPERDHAFYMSWLHKLMYDAAWPSYECEQCVDQDPHQGCWCSYHQAIAPNVESSRHHQWLRLLWSVIAHRCQMMDPARR